MCVCACACVQFLSFLLLNLSLGYIYCRSFTAKHLPALKCIPSISLALQCLFSKTSANHLLLQIPVQLSWQNPVAPPILFPLYLGSRLVQSPVLVPMKRKVFWTERAKSFAAEHSLYERIFIVPSIPSFGAFYLKQL